MADRQIIKEHYNQHVEEGVSTKQALQRRNEGPAAPLKKFHNEIKRRLIYRFAYQADALLDYACGRGGDLHKWKTAQIKFVKGLDLSPKEVEEARRRYAELLHKDARCHLQAVFEQTDHLGLQLIKEDREYSVITCMFALHYFFEKESCFKVLMETVAANLKPGGYFIGCVPDGKRVKAHLAANKEQGYVSKEHLYLKQMWEGKEGAFGAAYVMEIPDTVVQGHEGFTEGSHEYLVFEKILLGVARKYGLHPVVNYDDPNMDALFEEEDAGKPMKHFHPQFPPHCDGSLALASELYMAFVLQKVDSPDSVCAPKLPPPERTPGSYQQQQQRPQHQRPQQQRPQHSPTREERYGMLDSSNSRLPQPPQQPQWQQQQQQEGAAWRGYGRQNNKNADWQLPYQARHLPPQDLPSGYINLKGEKLAARQLKGRFVICPPEVPTQVGPIAVDNVGQPYYQQLPNGVWVSSYYDELKYHEQQQQQQHGLAAMGQQQHNQQQQQLGGGWSGRQDGDRDGGRPAGAAGPPVPSRQQQQQQPLRLPPPPPSPPKQQQQQQTDAGDDAAAAEGGSRGRGRGRGRGRKAAAAAAAEGDSGVDAVASPTRGRGRGSRGGRASGAKRARESSDAGDAAAAADAGGGEAAAAAAAAAGDGDGDGHGEPAGKRQAVRGGGAGKAGAGGRGGGGGLGMGRAPAADPLGYKAAVPAELSPELVESLAAMGPTYDVD